MNKSGFFSSYRNKDMQSEMLRNTKQTSTGNAYTTVLSEPMDLMATITEKFERLKRLLTLCDLGVHRVRSVVEEFLSKIFLYMF